MTRLSEISERLKAATPGPWAEVYNGNSLCSVATDYTDPQNNEAICIPMRPIEQKGSWKPDERTEADFKFIAHAPADIKFLLDALREAEERLADAMKDMDVAIEYLEDGHEASAKAQLERGFKRLSKPAAPKGERA